MQLDTIQAQTDSAKRVSFITLNRPKRMNALNSRLIAESTAAMDGCVNDASTNVIVVLGATRHFWVGQILPKCQDWTVRGNYMITWSGCGFCFKRSSSCQNQ